MNKGKRELNIAIVGGGPGCKAILKMFEKEKFRELKANVIGVADVNENGVGYQYAKMKGIPTATDYQEFYKDDLNLLIELTGSDEVLAEIMSNKPSSVKVIDHVGARFFWDFIQVEEEKLRVRRELQKKTEEYRYLFESISGYVLVVDRNYRIVQMNKNFERDFGNVIGWPCYSAFKKRTQKCVPCVVEDTFKDGMPHKAECAWTLPDGSAGCYIVHSSPIKDEKGETRYAMEMTIDITEKKRLEEQLVEAHNYTRDLIESSLDALVTFDKYGFITDVNEEMVRFTGYSREELVGSKFKNYFTDPDRAYKGVRRSFDEGKVTDYELVLKSKTGQESIVSYNATVYKDKSGKIKGVFAAVRDITEKKRLEEQLKEYAEGLEKMVEKRTIDLQRVQGEIKRRNIKLSALHSICSAVSSSLELEDMLHTAVDEVIKALGADSIGIYLRQEDGENLELACSKGYSEKFYQNPIVKRDVGDGILGKVAEKGIPMIFEDLTSSQTPYLDIAMKEGLKSAAYIPLVSKGKVFGVMRVSSHTSHRFFPEDVEHLTTIGRQIGIGIENSILYRQCKTFGQRLERSYQELKKSEEKYRSLFNADPNPIFIIDRETLKILDINSRAQDYYKYSKDELLQMSFIDLGYEEDEKVITDLKKITDNQSIFYSKRRHYRKDGSPFYVNIHMCPAKYMERNVLIATTTDITESVEKEANLVQAAKMGTLGQMASGIAHELNQPLSVIKAGSDFFLKMIKRGEKIEDQELNIIAQEIGTQVDRASEIINHLRIFARPSETVKAKIDINAPIRDVFKILGQQLKVHRIEVELDLDETLPPIMADYNRLEQVFMNLVLNAMDAMDEKEKKLGKKKIEKVLSIKSHLEDREVVVTVSDSGIGIPEKIMDWIFEPFFTTKEVGRGTGLGLSISYGIVKDYDGTIDIKSEEGIGSTFVLRFPACLTQ